MHVDENNILSVKNTFDAQVLINKTKTESYFVQKFIPDFSGTAVKLEDLEIGNQPVDDLSSVFQPDQAESNTYILKFPLPMDNKKVRVRRTTSYTQNLNAEPYVNIVIGRYIKGAIVSAKVNTGYRVKLVKSGLGTFNGQVEQGSRTGGYQTWTLASQGSLLLTGTGYIIFISKE